MRKSQTKSGLRPLKPAAVAAVTTAAVLAAPAMPASAAIGLSTTQVSSTGSTLYITGGTGFTDSLGIRYAISTNTCPAEYDTAQTGAVNGGTIRALSGTVARVQTPSTLVAGTTYKPCIYVGVNPGDDLDATNPVPVNITAMTGVAPLSPATGQPADKITLTANGAPFTLSSYASEFVANATACADRYTAPTTTTPASAIYAASTAKTSTSTLTITVPAIANNIPYLVCVYNGSVAGTSTLQGRSLASFVSYDRTLPTATVAPAGGNTGVETTVTLTASTAAFTGTPVGLITRNACPTTHAAASGNLEPYDVTVTKISTSKLAVTVPAATAVVSGTDVTTPWNVCIYGAANGSLVTAPAVFNAAQLLDVSTAVISPAEGQAAGGSNITVTGLTGIPTAEGATLRATLGGTPISNIKALSSTSFTGTTGYHAPGAVKLAVTTAAGTKTSTVNEFSYQYGLQVTPNTAPTGADQTLDIMGAGFDGLEWGAAVANGGSVADDAYVLLTDNTWTTAVGGGSTSIVVGTTNHPRAQCTPVLPISDNEIVCTLQLDNAWTAASGAAGTVTIGGNVPAGTYTITVTNTDTPDDAAFERSVVSSGATFTVSPF